MTKAAVAPERENTTTNVWRVVCHPTTNSKRSPFRLWDILRTDLGVRAGARHCRERINVDIALNLLSMQTEPDGRTVVRLACPGHVPALAVVGNTPNVVSAVCDSGILQVVVEPSETLYFEVDFSAVMTAPLDGLMRGRITVGAEAPAQEPEVSKPTCNIDYSTITSDISTGTF